MAGFIWRVIIAAVAVVLVYAILPPFCHLIGFTPSGDLMTILRIGVAALAILYVFFGPPAPPPWRSAP